ncbi:MAG: DMT family transporter [Chloroflexi bacterium]|nr:DMT family transporter [Chloroflexota bacterium]
MPPGSATKRLPTEQENSTEKKAAGKKHWQQGFFWALLSPLFLGTIPIFAKIAYSTGADVLTVVAFRTLFAALLIWVGMLLFGRHLIRSSMPAAISSSIAGAINGIGSLFFYASLLRIDASLGQLINITYLVFVTILLRIAGHTISVLTLFRIGLTILAIYLLTMGGLGDPDWVGVAMMLVAALTYAVQLVFSQRIMLDIPAPTMTLYAITAMAGVVSLAWLLFPTGITEITAVGWRAIFLMGLVTTLSRLTLFLGVKNLGSIQTALLGVLEVIVTIIIAIIFLGEHFTPVQWLGAALVIISVILVRFERNVPKFVDWWHLTWRWRLRQ